MADTSQTAEPVLRLTLELQSVLMKPRTEREEKFPEMPWLENED